MVTRIIPALLLIAVAAPAAAQNEAALKSYFEGKRVTVRMDMPGDADGVDVHADARIAHRLRQVQGQAEALRHRHPRRATPWW